MSITANKLLEFAKPYIKNQKQTPLKVEATDIYNHLRFHINGYKYAEGKVENPYFDILIDQRRPNESDAIKNYRRKIYLPKTKQPCFKVLNSLKKIVKSQDWSIDYTKSENPPIVGDETLEQYCEKKYPVFNSLENWLYSYAIKEVLTDPNGLIYIEPLSWEIKDGEKYEPVAKFVKTPNVLAYKEGSFGLFLSEHTNDVVIEGKTYNLPIYILITKDVFAYVKEINLDRTLAIEIKSDTLGGMTCFKAGGIYKDIFNGQALYDSFISSMLPSLDAAARESSDLDAEVVQHIYSQFWYYSGNDCTNCDGTGKTTVKNGEPITCKKCEGNGRLLKSPYKDIVVGKEGLGGDGAIPTPPAGYIQKTTDIVRLQDERIAAHEFEALSSLNMEFLAQTPLNQSGTAKEVDKDELNNFVYGVAYHIVENVLKPTYDSIARLRYGFLVSNDPKAIDLMQPEIVVPETYDLMSTNALMNNFKTAKDSGISSSIISEYEVDIINKMFSGKPETRAKLLLTKSLDPLKGIDAEEKTQLFVDRVITKEDYIASTYIDSFIEQLLNDNDDFDTWELEKQQEALYKLADEKEVDEVEEVKNSLIPPTPPNED